MCGRLIIIHKNIYFNNYHWHLIQIINDSNVSNSIWFDDSETYFATLHVNEEKISMNIFTIKHENVFLV